jgi:hypothetical protein
LDADQFERTEFAVIIFQAKLNRFASTLHEGVEVFRLGVATSQAWDCGDIVAFFVPFNDNCEFTRMLHRPILPCGKKGSRRSEAF